MKKYFLLTSFRVSEGQDFRTIFLSLLSLMNNYFVLPSFRVSEGQGFRTIFLSLLSFPGHEFSGWPTALMRSISGPSLAWRSRNTWRARCEEWGRSWGSNTRMNIHQVFCNQPMKLRAVGHTADFLGTNHRGS